MRKASARTKRTGKASRVLLTLWALAALLTAGIVDRAINGSSTGIAFAASSLAPGDKATVANTDGDPIRIREGAGTDFARIAWAREGEVVTILSGPRTDSADIRWFKVDAPGGTGWMMAQYLKGASAPAAPPQPKLTGTARVANTDGDPLRVRTAPSQDCTVITRLNPSTTVSIEAGPVTDDAGIVWYKIKAGNTTGWAMAQYLSQVQPEAAPAPRETGNPAPVADPVASAPSGGTSNPSQYRQWMEEARAMYPYLESIDKMWRVMMCESGANPNASGAGGRYLGLFQYAPGTWNGSWNPYRANSIFDARSQIFATANAWSIGMQNHWSCYYY